MIQRAHRREVRNAERFAQQEAAVVEQDAVDRDAQIEAASIRRDMKLLARIRRLEAIVLAHRKVHPELPDVELEEDDATIEPGPIRREVSGG